MDIVTRLKFFMDSLGIPSSQFADTCRIPRPTLSQLLNGRNKKISDELITKVHEAFPDLSVMWLMFGEGEMKITQNTQFSAPQIKPVPPTPSSQYSDNQNFSPSQNQIHFVEEFGSNRINPDKNSIKEYSDGQKGNSDNTSASFKLKEDSVTLTPDNRKKKITSILVFYDDNSFESFAPSN